MRPITALRADGVPVGELSRLTGVNIETIRYYEKIKMLPAPARTPRAVIGSMGRKKRAYSSSSAAVGS
jgi:MerR family transcriptional regulator, mercuric resistance operon regulatory protein